MQLFLASVLLVFVAAAFVPGDAIKCYACVYPLTSACEKPSINNNVRTCNGTSCAKVYTQKDGEKGIIRWCVNSRMENKCISGSEKGMKGAVCYCNTDRCNGVSYQSVSVVSMVTLVLCAVCAARWL